MDAAGAAALSPGRERRRRRTLGRRGRRALDAVALVLALAGVALAQDAGRERPLGPDELGALLTEPPVGTPCSAEDAIVEIEGVGRAVYDRIEYDGATGRARLWGGVCIEVPDAGLRLRAAEVRLAGLNEVERAPPTLTARAVVLDVQRWRLRVDALRGPVDALRADRIVLVAPGIVGTSSRALLTPTGGTLTGVSLATPTYLLQAREAEVDGERLLLRDASGTSCTCGVERYRLLGRELRSDASGGHATIDAPTLRVAGVEIPLGDRLVLREDGVPELELPVAVERRGELGSVAVLRIRPENGTRFELGVASEPALRPLTTLEVRRGGDVVRLEADGDGLEIVGRRRAELGAGAWAEALSVSEARGDEAVLRAGARAGWRGRTEVAEAPAGAVEATASLRAGAEIAAEPALTGAGVGRGPASPRLPLAAELGASVPLTSWAAAGLRVRGEAVGYPGAVAAAPAGERFGQASLSLEPSLTLEGGGARLALSAQRHWATGSTPFAFDALDDRARLIGDGRLRAGAWRANARVVWRLAPERPGAEELSAGLSTAVALGAGWRLEPSLRTELAGLAGGDADEAWIEAELAAVRDEDTRIGLRLREGVDPWSLQALEASVQAPIELGEGVGSVRLVPYLALDVAPWLHGGGPVLAGHGLRAYLRDCCGTLLLGYRSDQDGLRFDVGVRLPPLRLADLPTAELPPLPPLYGDAP